MYTLCPICQMSETRLEFPNASGPARRWPLVRCRRCGLVFQQAVRSSEELEEAQRGAYGEPQRRLSTWLETGIRIFRASRVRAATRLMPVGGRTLDIGCGRGLYLRMLKDRGYAVQGTELSEMTAANVDPEVPVDVGEVWPGRYPDASFDLISIWHVLEHLQHPERTLAACALALKPGGTLMLAMPNYASLQARFGGEHWFHLDLPRHIFHFTRETLDRLLRTAGLRVERCTTGQWEMDPFGWLQTTLNRLHLRHNALYDTLRNNPRDKRDLSPLYRLAMLLLFPVGMAIAAPLSLLTRALGRAGSLVVVARKNPPLEGHPERPSQREAQDD